MGIAASTLLKIGGDDSQFQAVVNRASARLSAFGKSIQGMGSKISGIGKGLSAAAGIAAAPLAAAIYQFNDLGDQFEKMATRTGFTVEALSELAYAADMSGTSITDIETSLTKLNKTLMKGGEESKTAVDAIERIGLSMEELEGLSPEDSFTKIASALHEVEDATLKNAAATALFGGSGAKLIPMLGDMQALREEARNLGVVMSTSQAKSAAAMNDSFGRIRFTMQSLTVSIASALAPTITDLANRAAGIISTVKKWVSDNQDLILSIGKGIAVVGGLGAGLIALGTTISVVGMGVAGLGTALSAIGAVVGAILSPVGLLIAGISAGAYAFLTMTDAGRSLVDFFVGEFQSLYSVVKPVLDSIISAFQMGDLQLAASIAFAAIKIPALSAWSYIKGIFDEGVFYVGSLWDGMVFGLMKAWTIVRSGLTWDFLKIGLLSVGKFLSDTFLRIVSGIADMFGWMVKKVAGALYALNIISDKTLVGVNSTIRDISKSISGLRDGNNSFYDAKINETKTGIANSEGGRELAALEQGRQQSVRDRAQSMIDSKSASEKAIADAQAELAALMKQQADLAATYKPAEPGQAKTAVQRAIEIQPQKIMSEMKTDVGSTASFNTRIANALAKNSQSRLAEKANQLLEQIAENTGEPNEATYGAGEG